MAASCHEFFLAFRKFGFCFSLFFVFVFFALGSCIFLLSFLIQYVYRYLCMCVCVCFIVRMGVGVYMCTCAYVSTSIAVFTVMSTCVCACTQVSKILTSISVEQLYYLRS